jgi:hypothetical protein
MAQDGQHLQACNFSYNKNLLMLMINVPMLPPLAD